MTPEEQQDLDTLKAEILNLKISAYDQCRSLSRYKQEDLKHTGHKTIESGVLWTILNFEAQIEKLRKAFYKKYPDDK